MNNNLPDSHIQQRNSSLWAIVPAAGLGQRMGKELPKQYLTVAGKAILERTIERLLSIKSITTIVVVLHKDDQHFEALANAKNPRVITTLGGQERCDSVLSALISLSDKVSNGDRVLVHDAARCCILPTCIEHLITTFKNDKVGGLLGVPVSDTLKRVSNTNKAMQTLDRNTIWQAQTPQLFPYSLLKNSLEKALADQQKITDEASAMEYCGFQPQMVMGHYDNIKVTHPDDIAIASAIINHQNLSFG